MRKLTVLNVNVPNNIALKYIKKYGQKINRHFKNKDIEMAYKRRQVFSTISYQGNTNLNYTEIPLNKNKCVCTPKVMFTRMLTAGFFTITPNWRQLSVNSRMDK